MRSKRMRQYRKKFRHVILFGKVVLIWYVMVFAVSYITTSDTTADFTDPKERKGFIYAADTFVDESSITFIKKDSKEWNTCESKTIKAALKNEGVEDMQQSSTYDVYFSKHEDPETDGKQIDLNVDDGIIPKLEVDESHELTFKATEAGRYKFVAYQLDEEETEVWSDNITIACETDQNKDADAKDDSELNEGAPSEDTTNEQDTSDDGNGTSDAQENEAEKTKDDKRDDTVSSKDVNDHSSSDESSEDLENDTEKGELADEKDDE